MVLKSVVNAVSFSLLRAVGVLGIFMGLGFLVLTYLLYKSGGNYRAAALVCAFNFIVGIFLAWKSRRRPSS